MIKFKSCCMLVALVITHVGAASVFAAEPLEEKQAEAAAIVTKAKALAAGETERAAALREIAKEDSRLSPAQDLLRACPDGVRRRFLSSIVLVDNKLAGATVNEIKTHLGEDRYGNLLTSLGVEMAADHAKNYCASRATCEPSTTAICTSNCRSSGFRLTASGEDIGYVSIEKILKGRSEEDRNRVLDSLTFVNGRVESPFLDSKQNHAEKIVLAAGLK